MFGKFVALQPIRTMVASLARVVSSVFIALALVGVDATPKTNYADVRVAVSHAFSERAHEMSATLEAVQEVSRATTAAIKASEAKCGST